MTRPRAATCCALAALLLVAAPGAARAVTYTVNSVNDVADGTPGNGVCAAAGAVPGPCTLRAAIQEANASVGVHDTIVLPAGTYNLTIGTPGDDTGATGDLDVTDGVTISGAGAASTVVNQTIADRVFDVLVPCCAAATVEIAATTVTGGELGGIRSGGSNTDAGVILTASAVVLNTQTTGGLGGGIDASVGPLTLNRTTVSDNTAPAGGGISLTDGATGTITNSTISKNTANATTGTVGGGGIRTGPPQTFGTPSATLTNTTVASNTAPAGTGGGLRRDTGPITLKNTIVADNTGDNCASSVPQPPPAFTSQGNNLEDANTCVLSQLTDKVNIDPQLGALADNGGGTRTHAIPATSPAVDAVAASACPPPATDQRNIGRPLGPACDIGAFEFAADDGRDHPRLLAVRNDPARDGDPGGPAPGGLPLQGRRRPHARRPHHGENRVAHPPRGSIQARVLERHPGGRRGPGGEPQHRHRARRPDRPERRDHERPGAVPLRHHAAGQRHGPGERRSERAQGRAADPESTRRHRKPRPEVLLLDRRGPVRQHRDRELQLHGPRAGARRARRDRAARRRRARAAAHR